MSSKKRRGHGLFWEDIGGYPVEPRKRKKDKDESPEQSEKEDDKDENEDKTTTQNDAA